MKKLILICLSVVVSTVALLAQAPAKFSYQAVIRNAENELLTNQQVAVKISLLQGSESGNSVFEETHNVNTNANGLISLQVGAGNNLSGDLSLVDWADGAYFIKIETDPNGGINYSIEGTTELLSVPYALYSLNSQTPGPQGPQGVPGADGLNGTDGEDGISIQTTEVIGDSLFVILSDGQTINAGFVKGPQGEQGIAGPQGLQGVQGVAGPQGPSGANGLNGADGEDGISIQNTEVIGDSLFVTLSDGQTLNAGFVRGPQGVQGIQGIPGQDGDDGLNGEDGVSIQNTEVIGDSLFVTLSDGQTINAGFVRGPEGSGSGSSLADGNNPGDMYFWDGNDWAFIPIGSPGQVLQINTSGLPQWAGGGYATVLTLDASAIGAQTATLNGDILEDGGSAITEKGFVYGTTPAPTLTNEVLTAGSGTGSFNATATGLDIGQTYYVRAYATNDAGTVYGNEIVFTTNSTYNLGDIGPAGGFIFYDKGEYTDGWRYMEAAPVDQSTGVNWGCSGTLIPGSLPSAIGFGPANTQAIRGTCTSANTAAARCDTYELNGFTDWFLPSRMELQLMHSNLNAGTASFNTLSTYWSSTQNNNISAQGVSWSTGNTINQNKVVDYRVRAARRF